MTAPTRRGMTVLEVAILQDLCDLTHTEVAARRGITTDTVKGHTRRIRAKLRARNTSHAIAIGMRLGIIR